MADLLSDLQTAERANMHAPHKTCPACDLLASPNLSEDERSALAAAMAGTIGTRTLSKILSQNGYPISDRKLRLHREEKRPA